MNNAIVFDIDGTISDPTHRLNLAQMKQWDDFNAAAIDDPVISKIADLMRELSKKWSILLVTGRNEKFRYVTTQWLKEANLDFCYDDLLMRKDYDFRPDYEIKIELLEKYFGGKEKVLENVFAVFDDRDSVVEHFRNYGFTVLQVAQGGY